MKTVTTKSIGVRESAGIGYIIIPQDKDIANYVKYCFTSGSVSIALENGGIINNVTITKSALKDIDFPEEKTKLGSMVVWLNRPKTNTPIIVGVITKNNEIVLYDKDTISLKGKSKTGSAEVVVDKKNNNVIINANSLIDEGGNIYIVSNNKAKSSKISISISDLLELICKNASLQVKEKFEIVIKNAELNKLFTKLGYENGVGFSYVDEFQNIIEMNEDNIHFDPNKLFNIGDGNEPITLANTLDDLLGQFIDIVNSFSQEVSKLTVTTAMGPSGAPINLAEFTKVASDLLALKEQFVNFKSKKSFTD